MTPPPKKIKFAYFDCSFLVLLTVLAVYVMSASANLPLMMVLAVAMALMFIGSSGVVDGAVLPPAHCNPEVSEALPPRLRRICAALYGIAEISSAVEQYLDDKGICHSFIQWPDNLPMTIVDQPSASLSTLSFIDELHLSVGDT